jgi:hypothetical protein
MFDFGKSNLVELYLTSTGIFLLREETYKRSLKDQCVGLRLGFLLEWDTEKKGGLG